VTTGTNAPFSYEKDGDLVGFDIDLIRVIAEAMGREIKVERVPFKDLMDKVASRQADIAIDAISITDDRKGIVDFITYHRGGFAAVVFGDAVGFDEPKNLSGKKIAVCLGSVLDKLLKQTWLEIPNVDVRSVDIHKYEDISSNLRSGEWHAFVMDADSAKHFVATHPGFSLVPLNLEPLPIGLAVLKGSHYAQQITAAMESKKDRIESLKNEHFSAATMTS
jgi:polar amino acid transport system substrate-binding protein